MKQLERVKVSNNPVYSKKDWLQEIFKLLELLQFCKDCLEKQSRCKCRHIHFTQKFDVTKKIVNSALNAFIATAVM